MVKLKAATLVESMIAMVIIVLSLGITTMIYTNVIQSDHQREQLKGMLLIKNEVVFIKANKKYLDDEKVTDNYVIKSVIQPYKQSEDLYQLSLSAKNAKGKLVASHSELIIIE